MCCSVVLEGRPRPVLHRDWYQIRKKRGVKTAPGISFVGKIYAGLHSMYSTRESIRAERCHGLQMDRE